MWFVKFFITDICQIFQALLNLNNFAGMFVINASLESASIFRLKHTLKVSSFIDIFLKLFGGLVFATQLMELIKSWLFSGM